ncbi:altronate oxidoreductase [Candidatus Epulonipiscium fishelsonii]|uniref:Altronate oxidoreductase n=1 Tax=Candidatus Epulonipiscium fishelsonii TaxID=77094 RepID=A0ACC8X9H1_9FIRM|nr:altronate oxidoreductase [Epulopiscium sp. SCG-D08WGA-EpuloA1]
MNQLNYNTLEEVDYKGFILPNNNAKIKVLQFGEGNFLRAFVDYFIDILNEKCNFNSKVVLVQPIAQGLTDIINKQEGLYTLYLRGMEDGKQVNEKRIISSVSHCINPYTNYEALLDQATNNNLRFIVSNTTEAGIVFDESCKFDDKPPSSFPAKLTRFMYERFKLNKKGFVILSCELIDNNGKELQKCVNQYIDLWNLEDAFKKFVNEENIFCSTLVDRIVTGFPKGEINEINKENGYIDNLVDTGEIFGFWAIEGPASLKEELPFEKAGLPVIIINDQTPYKKRKVRILNGAHTSMIMAAYLAGKDIVRECMQDDVIVNFMNNTIKEEIIPMIDLDKKDLENFANSVVDRFNNPYIDHQLLSISLNSTSKWKARVLPSLVDYYKKFNKLPQNIVFSFAAYIEFYKNNNNRTYNVVDDQWVLDFFKQNKDLPNKELVNKICANEKMWGQDLTQISGFENQVLQYINQIEDIGIYENMKLL